MTYFKQEKIRSTKITKSAKGEACTLRIPGVCNGDPSTTVFAHLPGNKGIATKNHDLFGVYACSLCHLELDAGNVNARDQLRALQETSIKLYHKKIISVS